MDTKSLAKSKRAHSQHHSKKSHSSNQKAKDGARPSRALGKQIPTNWDRYDEELDSSSQDGASDIVLPKSKGADYTHLIAEAQSQSLSQFDDDDVLSGEWNRGIMSMLSARGESILSWIGDDNFVVDDKTAAAHHEVSFLSLNLHSLAEQLEKVDLPQRLYIEADLLPLELNAEDLESTSSQSADQVQPTFVKKGTTGTPEASTSGELPDQIDVAGQDIEIMISSSVSDCLDDVDLSKLGKSTDPRKLPDANTQSSGTHFADIPNKNVATFEAATAEEELDMLLDSFSETKINDPSGLRSLQEEASVPPLQLPRKGTDSSILMATNLDDALDDLMNETSIPIKQSRPSHPQETMVVHDFQSSSHTGSKSKELDDFDSWFDTL